MRNSKVGRQRGFTLIELMIVVSVIAVLLAIGIPAYGEQVRKARRADVKAELQQMVQRLERHHTVNNTYQNAIGPNGVWPSSPIPVPAPPSTAHYLVTPSNLTRNTYLLTAVPQGQQAADACGELSISSTGQKGRTGTAPLETCW